MSEVIKVLHIAHLKGSGIGTVVMNLFRNIDRDKISFDFWVEDDGTKAVFEDEAIQLGAKIYKYPKTEGVVEKHFMRLNSLYNTIKAERYKIVHIHASDSICLEYAIICKLAGLDKIIVHSHNSYIPNDERNHKIKIKIHKLIKPLWNVLGDYFIAVSEDAAKWMYNNRILKGNNFHILRNGIDVEHYKYNTEIRRYWRQKLDISDNTLLLGNVGRLVDQKNPIFLIEILREVKRNRKNTKLILVGRDGTQRDRMEKLIKQYRLEDDVIFFGESNEVNQLLQAMDVFVFPSYFEGLGIVAVEAQAAGLPVIASEGVPKDAKASKNFWQIDLCKGSSFWASKIIELSLTYRRRDTAAEVWDSGYEIQNTAKWIEQLYLEV